MTRLRLLEVIHVKIQVLAAAVALTVGSYSIALAGYSRDGAIIHNSGSTNTAPYSLKVWSDGSAAVVNASGSSTPFKVPMNVVASFFRDVQSARGNPGTPGHCMKSASFGTSTVVTWHGWHSFDLSCPPVGEQTELAANVRAIQSAARVLNTPPHRIPLMPGELRRTPGSAASPSPTASGAPAPKEHRATRQRQGM